MALLNCLWIGALAGLVACRLMRARTCLTSAASSMAVGALGALIGTQLVAFAGHDAAELSRISLLAAALGAILALASWRGAQRHLANSPGGDR